MRAAWPELKAEREQYALTRAVLDLAQSGLKAHCQDQTTDHLWLSEDQAERSLACTLCDGCPILDPCLRAAKAQGETATVRGGFDFHARVWMKAG